MKHGLPIVDTVAKANNKSGARICVGIQEGVYNSCSPYTLISEFQLRNSGIILDLVACNHRLTPDGLFGTLSLYDDLDNPEDMRQIQLVE